MPIETTNDYDGLLARFQVGQMQNATLKADVDRLNCSIKKIGNFLMGGHHSEALGEILKALSHVK